MNRTRWRLVAGGVLAAALAVGVSVVAVNCAGPEARSPIQFRDPAAWTHEDAGLDSVLGASIRGDAVVLAGERDNQVRLVVADAESGTEQWSIAENQVLPGGDNLQIRRGYLNPFTGLGDAPVIAEKGDDWSVVVSYSRFKPDTGLGDDPVDLGIASLSGEDGSLEWARPLAEPLKGEKKKQYSVHQENVVPVAADGGIVLAATPVGPRAFAVDAETGEKRWDREGIWPHSVTNGVVLGQNGSQGDHAPGNESEIGTGAIYGWDAESGKELWRTGKSGEDLSLELATETVAVVSVDRARAGRVINVETGAKLAELDAEVDNCAADATDPDRLVCAQDALHVVTASGGKATVTESAFNSDVDEFTVTGMYDGRVFVQAVEGSPSYRGAYVIDTEAEFLAKDVPGRPEAMSKEYALFLHGESGFDESYAEAAFYEVVTS